MKRGRKKSGSADTGTALPEETVTGRVVPEDDDSGMNIPAGTAASGGGFAVDGVRALQAAALVIALLCLAWLVLRNFLHLI